MSPGEWLTTAPHPWKKAHRVGEDQNQVGWRLHYVEAGPDGRRRAICGLSPAHGWGVDLFIEAPCERCYRAAQKRGIPILPASVKEFENKVRVRALLRASRA